MENSYFTNTNWRLPFGGFQARGTGDSVCGNRSSAPPHNAAFSSHPPPPVLVAEPQFVRTGQRPSSAYAADHNSSNNIRQATPIAAGQFGGGLPPTMPLPPGPQFQPSVAGEFRPSSWYINTDAPPPPVNVGVPPPQSANVNAPPPPPPAIPMNIPPPGFNPRVLPPPIFSPQHLPPVAVTSSSLGSSLPLTSARWASFTDQTNFTGARQPTFRSVPPHVSHFINRQRFPPSNSNDDNSGFAVQPCRPVRQRVCGSFFRDDHISYLQPVQSSISQVYNSSAVLSDKRNSVEKCLKSSSLSLSTADDSACPSIGTTALVSTTVANLVSQSRRRRTSTRNCITVSCN